MRYEEPSSMVRWDSPLFTIAWDEIELPKDQIWLAIVRGDIKPANVGTRAVSLNPLIFSSCTKLLDRRPKLLRTLCKF